MIYLRLPTPSFTFTKTSIIVCHRSNDCIKNKLIPPEFFGELHMNLSALLYDVVVRVPNIQIIFKDNSFYTLDGLEYTNEIPNEVIEELVNKDFAKYRSNGSIEITSEGIDFAHNVEVKKVKVESKKSPGHFFDAHVTPEKWSL